jgi:O-acetyl-ADP-ribose deacetylase (regulator of RNase III)
MAVIEVVLGDITVQDVDVIVTAANESLLGGGGVDEAIHRAAGPRLAEAGAAIGPCEPGDAMAMPSFGLDPRVRHVIHTVGPVWEAAGSARPPSWPRATGAACR